MNEVDDTTDDWQLSRNAYADMEWRQKARDECREPKPELINLSICAAASLFPAVVADPGEDTEQDGVVSQVVFPKCLRPFYLSEVKLFPLLFELARDLSPKGVGFVIVKA